MPINPEMLVLARESRGMTQSELSKITEINQSTLSKYENGMLEVSPDVLTIISDALNYPESMFTRSQSILGFGSACMYHRKRQTLSVSHLKRIQAKINLMRIHVERLLISAEIETPFDFPVFDVQDSGNPEDIAELVRQAWSLPIGPIKNLVKTIESAGGIVIPFSFGVRKLDAISQWPRNMPPLFFINEEMPWDRIRFSLAHEIGHLVMHRKPTPEQESEADRFASAFLMPEQDIKVDLMGIDLVRAADLKPYWRTSMQALIRRAYDIGQISEHQYRRLFTEISKNGYRINEPYPISKEEPSVLNSLIKVHLHDHHYTLSELGHLLDLHESELKSQYLNDVKGPILL